MKAKFNHWYNAIAATLLSLLGFSACSEIGGEEPVLYGSPNSEYQFKGNVTNEEAQPIKGIKAVMCFTADEKHYEHLDSAYTDANGNYVSEAASFEYTSPEYYVKEGKMKIVLEDVDGEANGGKFANDTIESKDMTVEKIKEGSGAWDWGTYEVTAKTKKLKKEQ